MKKIWSDNDLFEVAMRFFSKNCHVKLELYLDNAQLEELKNGIRIFANKLGNNTFTWITGEEHGNTTHFLSMRYFLYDRRGIVGIEIQMDNKLEPPHKINANFYILTEVHQIDILINKLDLFIKGEINKFESLKSSNL